MTDKIEVRIKELDKLQKQLVDLLKADVANWSDNSTHKPTVMMASAVSLRR